MCGEIDTHFTNGAKNASCYFAANRSIVPEFSRSEKPISETGSAYPLSTQRPTQWSLRSPDGVNARKPLPARSPRTEIVLEPEGDLSGLKCIGQEVTETLNWIPGRLEVVRRVRPKYVDPGPGRDHRSAAEAVDPQEYGRTQPDGGARGGQVHRPPSVLPVPGPDQSRGRESLEGDRQWRVHDSRPVSDALGTSFARGSALRRIPPSGRDASQGTGFQEEGHHAPHLPLGVLRTRVPSGVDGLPPDAHAAGDSQRLQRCTAHGRVHGIRRLQRASGCMAAGCMRG